MSLYKKLLILTPVFLLFIILTYLVSDHFFFWDTVQLGSRHAYWYFENDFKYLLLPDGIDSGHIPAFGMYLALMWKLFGKSLAVSHFAMLPFLLGIIWQAYNLIEKFIAHKYVYLAFLLFLADPTLLGQSVLVSPDIPMIFFFLLAINACFNKRRILLSFAILGMFFSSMRGVMVGFAVFLFDIIYHAKRKSLLTWINSVIRLSLTYMPALIILISYLLFHYYSKGWVGIHDNSPWAGSFKPVGIKGIFKNIGLMGWRLLDFGRVFLWLTFISVLAIKGKKLFRADNKIILLILLFLLPLVCLSYSSLFFYGLNSHRYFLPLILSFSLLTSYIIFNKLESVALKYFLFIALFIGLLSGNFWVYPLKIAQGWDASLAHLPYYNLWNKMVTYMESEDIDIRKTGSDYPNLAPIKFLKCNDDTRAFAPHDLNKQEYIFYSNIFNGFSDSEIDSLLNHWIEVKRFQQFQIFVSLYKNPGYEETNL